MSTATAGGPHLAQYGQGWKLGVAYERVTQQSSRCCHVATHWQLVATVTSTATARPTSSGVMQPRLELGVADERGYTAEFGMLPR